MLRAQVQRSEGTHNQRGVTSLQSLSHVSFSLSHLSVTSQDPKKVKKNSRVADVVEVEEYFGEGPFAR